MGDWDRLTADLRWILDPRNNARGFGKMKNALKMNDQNYMGAVKEAFFESTDQGGQHANFDACAQENQGRVYSIGRSLLPPD